MKNFTMKIESGSNRDKIAKTPKQNKWANPFYAFARGKSKAKSLYNHNIDSIREHINGTNDIPQKGLFHRIGSAIAKFFRFNRSRKGLA